MSRWIFRWVRLGFMVAVLLLMHHQFYRPALHLDIDEDEFLTRRSSKANFAVVTFGEHDRLELLLNMIGSVHFWSPWVPIIVYSKGLLGTEILALSCLQNVHVRTVKNLKMQMHMQFVRHALETEYESVLFLDPSIEVRTSLARIADAIHSTGSFFVSRHSTIEENIFPGDKVASHVPAARLKKKMSTEYIYGFRRNSSAIDDVLLPAIACRLDKKCIHQASASVVLSILVYEKGYVVQDPFHFLFEENPLYFRPDSSNMEQPHTFLLRNNLDPFPYIQQLQPASEQCVSTERALDTTHLYYKLTFDKFVL
jgi:hypothetical protein